MKLLPSLDHHTALDHHTVLDHHTAPVGPDTADLAAVAGRIERFGFDAIEPTALATIAHRARLAGVHPEVAALLTDADAPSAVRARAFGLVHRRLATWTPAGTDPILAAA